MLYTNSAHDKGFAHLQALWQEAAMPNPLKSIKLALNIDKQPSSELSSNILLNNIEEKKEDNYTPPTMTRN